MSVQSHFDRKFALRHVSGEGDLAGCPVGRGDVTDLTLSCQKFCCLSWWLSVP